MILKLGPIRSPSAKKTRGAIAKKNNGQMRIPPRTHRESRGTETAAVRARARAEEEGVSPEQTNKIKLLLASVLALASRIFKHGDDGVALGAYQCGERPPPTRPTQPADDAHRRNHDCVVAVLSLCGGGPVRRRTLQDRLQLRQQDCAPSWRV